jgi:integrase
MKSRPKSSRYSHTTVDDAQEWLMKSMPKSSRYSHTTVDDAQEWLKRADQQVLACAPPNWIGTRHGSRSVERVRRFVEYILCDGTVRQRLRPSAADVFDPLRPSAADVFDPLRPSAADVFDPPNLSAYLDHLAAIGLSAGSRNRAAAAVLTVWRCAHRRGLLGAPPVGMYAREPKGRTRVLTDGEVRDVVAALPHSFRYLVAFLHQTGCRVSEALKLEARDVDLDLKRVTFRDTKSGGDRTVPLTACALDIFPYIPADPFAHLSQSAFNRAWASARKKMGLEKDDQFVPHALRHGAVTRWVRAGIPLPVVSQMAGHRSPKTTYRYSHTTVDDAQEWLKRVDLL